MLFSNTILEHCEQLSRLGYRPPMRAGALVARGFADIGYEVFCILPNNRLVSLFTGESIAFDAEQSTHFFSIPDCDSLLSELDKRGAEVLDLRQEERWSWTLRMRLDSRNDSILVSGGSLAEVFRKALQEILVI